MVIEILQAYVSSIRADHRHQGRLVHNLRSALQNASSIASLLLTTEALVSEIPEDKKDAGGGGHSHGGPGGGMGGMY